ncbi:MAG TPA: glycine betaine ABC transporter substrate-binding protein [Nocardioidaceae bacterium]|nr:glycine betaine ABC transporter substrate-binding protein [Nocardioidaceae bacterium]
MSTRRVPRGLGVLLALLILAACGTSQEDTGSSQPQGASLRITLGTQVFPEARILGEMWRQALAVNGYTVDLRKGVGPAEDLDALLQEGAIDGYVAYTGTVLSIVAGQDVTGLDPEATYARAKAFYETRDMAMSAMTPFENKDAIATTSQFAQSEELRSIADLAELPSVTLAARPEFESLYLGLEGLEDVYGLSNVQFEPVPVGRQYGALESGAADAVNAFTTDPQLREGDFQVLEDPKLLFGSQNVVMVVGSDELERVGEETFLEVVDTVNGALTQDVMVGLNAEVTAGQDEEDVANDFLRQTGLLRPIGGEG